MDRKAQITQVIFSAIDNVNRLLKDHEKIEKSLTTELIGESDKLDSLGLVNLIVAIEEGIQESFGKIITLASENAMSSNKSPFKNVQSLADYIDSILEENQGE